MNYIPRIVYTKILTGEAKDFTFDSEPEKDPFNEKITAISTKRRSTDGTQQVEFSYRLLSYTLKFLYQSKDTYDEMLEFVEHGFKGGTFNYYPSSDETDYETYELQSNSITFDRPTKDGVDFTYNFGFTIERVVENVIDLDTGEAGLGAIGETSYNLTNNVTVAEDIEGLAFELPDTNSIRACFVEYTIYRVTTGGSGVELSEAGEIKLVYNSAALSWDMQRDSVGDAGVTITILANGQMQYISTNEAGTPSVFVIRFKARTLGQELGDN